MKNLAPIPIKADKEFVDFLNAVRLKEVEIVEAIQVTVDSADSGEAYLRNLTATIELFPTAPQKARAVIFRLQALSLMMERNELRNWMLPGSSSFTKAGQRAVIAALTHHPLSLINGEITFEKESFLQRILLAAEYEGKVTS